MPLLRTRPELVERARALAADLRPRVSTMYDDTASIGKLYRRQDEVGTPFRVTVDVESLDKALRGGWRCARRMTSRYAPTEMLA
jgi:glycyl-tRNA synthetase